MDLAISFYIAIAIITTGANFLRLGDARTYSSTKPEEIKHLSRCVLLSPVWPVLLTYVFYRVYKEAL